MATHTVVDGDIICACGNRPPLWGFEFQWHQGTYKCLNCDAVLTVEVDEKGYLIDTPKHRDLSRFFKAARNARWIASMTRGVPVSQRLDAWSGDPHEYKG